MRRAISDITVAAPDGAAHNHHTFQFAKGVWLFIDGRAYVYERPDADERDFSRVLANLVEEKCNGVRMRWLRKVSALRVAELREFCLRRRGWAGGYLNFPASRFSKQAIEKLCPRLGVAKGCSDAENLELRAS